MSIEDLKVGLFVGTVLIAASVKDLIEKRRQKMQTRSKANYKWRLR